MSHPDRTSDPAFPVKVGGESQPVDTPSPSRYLLRASGSNAGKVILYRPARPCVLYFYTGTQETPSNSFVRRSPRSSPTYRRPSIAGPATASGSSRGVGTGVKPIELASNARGPDKVAFIRLS